jgi:hypothetical protein
MAGVEAGVVTQAQLNTSLNALNGSPNTGIGGTAAAWSYVWFGAAVLFIMVSYFGFGGLRGQVAS